MGYIEETSRIYFSITGGTGTLQDAIVKAQTTKKPLFIAPGDYPTGDLVISAPVSISATPGTVTLSPISNSTTGYSLAIRSNTAGTTITDVSISGILFYGAGKSFASALNGATYPRDGHYDNAGNFNALIWAANVKRLSISQCRFGYSGSNAIAMWDVTATVTNNEFEANKLCAVFTSNCWGTLIADNFIRSGDNAGILVFRSGPGFEGTVIRGNHVYNIDAKANLTAADIAAGRVSGSGWYGNGIYVQHADHAIISDNVILNCKFSGIRNLNSWNCHISGNQIRDCGEVALMVEGLPGKGLGNTEHYEGGIVSGNTITSAGHGISVTNDWQGGRRVVVSGNVVQGITKKTVLTNHQDYPSYYTHGGGITGAGDVVISGNIVESAPDGPGIAINPRGMALDAEGQFTANFNLTASAVGNTVRGAKFGIGFQKDSIYARCLVSSNIVQGATQGAIVPIDTTLASSWDYFRVPGSLDYGFEANGAYAGKPFPNVTIGHNLAFA